MGQGLCRFLALAMLVLVGAGTAFGTEGLAGFSRTDAFGEQGVMFRVWPDVRVFVDAPSAEEFDASRRVGLALYALPNGNTIEQTVGKVLEAGDDFRFGIQHIGAQTRFLRECIDDYNLVVVYLETAQRSWPAWRGKYANHPEIVRSLVEYLPSCFADYDPFIILTGHSGGGRFTFSFIDACDEIPDYVERIAFLDSTYGYEHSYGDKFVNWLKASDRHCLTVLAYNDSVVVYNGEPLVSPTGGTWYRSRIMWEFLAERLASTSTEDDEFIRHRALDGRVDFALKKNPKAEILHTVQVEKNGFIHAMLSGTAGEGQGYEYYGDRVYDRWIQAGQTRCDGLMIPLRSPEARTGSVFMRAVEGLPFAEREEAIYRELSTGNVPNHLRRLKRLEGSFADANGVTHRVQYDAMPDYLAVGSDDDFCRVPMGPATAQRVADWFGATLPTPKLVDHIYRHAETKLEPITYKPVGHQNEWVSKFVEHNQAIEAARRSAGGTLGQLVAGTKKDIVLSNLIADPNRTHHVVIYGWHRLDGTPIQPVTNIHIDTYVDYSHGVRLLSSNVTIDGQVRDMATILSDPVLYKVLSDEMGPMTPTRYND